MSSIWKAILTSIPDLFGQKVKNTKAIPATLLPLFHYGVIKITGKDASRFLQGQLTNDCLNLSEGQWQLSAYCNHKGRVIGFGWLARQANSYFFCLPTDSIELCLTDLQKFKLFAKVEFSYPISLYPVAVLGDFDQTQVSSLPKIFATMGPIGSIPLSLLLFEQKPDLDNKNFVYPPKLIWELACIANRLSIINFPQQGIFTPHQLGLIENEVISFKKGCYRGQEVIARMHYLGKLKQQLFPIILNQSHQLTVVDQLTTEDNRSLGQLINLTYINEQLSFGLAVLNVRLIPNQLPATIKLTQGIAISIIPH